MRMVGRRYNQCVWFVGKVGSLLDGVGKRQGVVKWQDSLSVVVGVIYSSTCNRMYSKMSHITRKPVFVGLRPGKTQAGLLIKAGSYRDKLESWQLGFSKCRYYTLNRQRTTKALIRLHGCTGWSAPLLFAYDINQVFSCHGSIYVTRLIFVSDALVQCFGNTESMYLVKHIILWFPPDATRISKMTGPLTSKDFDLTFIITILY